MLGLLVSAGYAGGRGAGRGGGAGRPHVVYEVDLARLRQVMASGAGVVAPAGARRRDALAVASRNVPGGSVRADFVAAIEFAATA